MDIDYAGYSIKGKLHRFNEDRYNYAAKLLCELAEIMGSTDDITSVIVEILKFD